MTRFQSKLSVLDRYHLNVMFPLGGSQCLTSSKIILLKYHTLRTNLE